MYGTVARMRVKPGMEQQLMAQVQTAIPGMRGIFIYRMDADPDEYYVAVLFESKEAYVANAKSSEQDARYQLMVAALESPPEWHDGEIVFPLA